MDLQEQLEDREAYGPKAQISIEEMEDNEDMLIRTMHERFLRGEDKIHGISDNEDYDDVTQMTRDDEEAYFDQLEPNICYNDTGVQDF